MHLFQKHAPQNLGEFAGNPTVVEEVKRWALLFEAGKLQKPLLVYGPPGVGKTALVYALAHELGWEILEFNASDTRNKGEVERLMGAASSSMGLFSKYKLILIDEVDGLEGSADRGGVSAIATIAKNASQPLILLANDGWNKRIAPLRTICKFIEMKKVNKRTVQSVIARIAKEERMDISEDDIASIAENSDGDLRSAIIDLQAHQPNSMRDRDQLVFECMKGLFKAGTYQEAINSFNGATLDHDLIKLWIEQNIASEYEKINEIASAYDWLSRADLFDGRLIRRQSWKLLKYSNALMLAGVALSKDERYHKFVKYEFPEYLRMMSMSAEKRGLMKTLRKKIALKCHVSVGDAESYFLPLQLAAKAGQSLDFFELSEDELEFVKKL